MARSSRLISPVKNTLFLLAFFALSTSFAQNRAFSDTANIPEVVVKATLIADSLRKVPASINVLDEADLAGNNGTIITSAMNTLPGIYMQQGALNTNRITIRGIGARTQYGTDRVKAYIDGIPISSAAGNTVIEDIDLDILESVEIIKGPVSSIYGTGLGGAISLYTSSPNQNKLQLNTTIGSFGLLKNSLSLALAGQNGGGQLTYSQLDSDGYRENSTYSRKSLTVNGAVLLSAKTRINLFANWVRLKAQIPSSLNHTDFKNNPTSADRKWAAAEGFESYDKLLTGITLAHEFSTRFQNSTSIFLHYRDGYEPRPFDILDEDQLGLGARTVFNFKYPLLGKSSELVFGAEYLLEDYTVSLYENLYLDFPGNGSVKGDKINSNEQNRSYANIFIAQQWSVSNRVILDLGLNVNATMYDLEDTFPGDSLDQSGSYQYGIIASPRVAANYELSTDKNLYASISHGFSTPGVEETLTPSGKVNTSLLPETGINLELGLKSSWFKQKLYAEAALFTIFIDNLLVAQRVAEDQYVGVNAGKTQHTGMEISIHYKELIAKKWLLKPYISAAINDFKFQDFEDGDQNFSGNELTGVPGHTLNLGLESQFLNGFSFRLNVLNVGEIPLNDANTVYSGSYNLVNLKAGYTFKMLKRLNLEIYGGINNLTDENYAASILPNAVGFGGAQPRYYYPGDARNFYAGLKIDWNY